MERETLVLDASVVIKWFTQEENREKAINLREKFINDEIEIIVPDLIFYEISNALRFNPNFSINDVQDAINSIFGIGIDITIPLSITFEKAIEISFSKNITLYDAFYEALALELNGSFVTADKKLYDKIKDIGNVILLKEI